MNSLNSKLSSYQNPKGTLKDRLVPRTDLRLSLINWNLFKGRSVLDIGCSKCSLLLVFIKLGYANLYGIENEPYKKELWLKDPKIFDKYWGNEKGKIKLAICDIDTEVLPFDSNSKSIIILNQVFEHLHNPSRILREVFRVLKKDGILMIGTPNVANLKNRIYLSLGKSNYWPLDGFLKMRDGNEKFVEHVREYTMEELEKLVKLHNLKVIHKSFIPTDFETNFPKSKLVYKIYQCIEKIYPRFRYNLCIIAQKKY